MYIHMYRFQRFHAIFAPTCFVNLPRIRGRLFLGKRGGPADVLVSVFFVNQNAASIDQLVVSCCFGLVV